MKSAGQHRYGRHKRLCTVAYVSVLALALSGVAGGSASALTWATKSTGSVTKFVNGQEETVTPAIKSGTEFLLEWTVGSTPVEMAIKKLSGEATRIKQEGTVAKDSGKLIFSEIRLLEPATCTAPEKIRTNALKSELVESPALASGLADKFLPAEGEVVTSLKLGGSCAIAGTTVQMKTTKGFYAETEKRASYLVEQPLRFSPTINENAGGNLLLGTSPVRLTGEWVDRLSGTLAGREWGAE